MKEYLAHSFGKGRDICSEYDVLSHQHPIPAMDVCLLLLLGDKQELIFLSIQIKLRRA